MPLTTVKEGALPPGYSMLSVRHACMLPARVAPQFPGALRICQGDPAPLSCSFASPRVFHGNPPHPVLANALDHDKLCVVDVNSLVDA